jgi:glycosyltransferase involved in cell wall biosynthesis
MRVLALTKYDRLAASTRQRFELYCEGLQALGVEMTIAPLLSNRYLEKRFETGRQAWKEVLLGYFRRLYVLAQTRTFDVVFVHTEFFPFFPGLAEHFLARLGVPLVIDVDDAIFHQYEQLTHRSARLILRNKMARVFRVARAATCGSRYLRDYAAHYTKRAELIPTVVDTSVLRPSQQSVGGKVTIGWIGSPSTATSLSIVRDALVSVARDGRSRFVAVGSGPLADSFDAEVRSWAEDRETADLQSFEIGIMPLEDTAWNRGKCAFKLIQYMAAGLPTVSSPVGANLDVVTPRTGLFASTSDEWRRALAALVASPELRASMGSAGRQRAVARFSLSTQLPRLAEVLEYAARTR